MPVSITAIVQGALTADADVGVEMVAYRPSDASPLQNPVTIRIQPDESVTPGSEFDPVEFNVTAEDLIELGRKVNLMLA